MFLNRYFHSLFYRVLYFNQTYFCQLFSLGVLVTNNNINK